MDNNLIKQDYYLIENKNLDITLYIDNPNKCVDDKIRIYDKYFNYTGEYWERDFLISKAEEYNVSLTDIIEQRIIKSYEEVKTFDALIELLNLNYTRVEKTSCNIKEDILEPYIILGKYTYYLSED